MSYYVDTYAMIEIVRGNPKYEKYVDEKLFTTLYNLFEFYYVLIRDYNEEVGKKYYNIFNKLLVDIKDEYIFEASKFKLNNSKKRLSYVDCLGYIISLNLNIRFLTGDKEFENLENVEFVKKD